MANGKRKRKNTIQKVTLTDRHPGLTAPRGAQVAGEEAIEKIFTQTSDWVTQWLRAQTTMPSDDEIMQQVDEALDQIFGKEQHDGPTSPYGQLLVRAVRKGQRDFLQEQASANIAMIGERPITDATAHGRRILALRQAAKPKP